MMLKKFLQIVLAVLMLLLSVIPALVIYEPLSKIIPIFPVFQAPFWFIPFGFASIILIVCLSFLLSFLHSKMKNR